MKPILLILIFGLCLTYASSFASDMELIKGPKIDERAENYPEDAELIKKPKIEERAGNYPGLTAILGSMATLLESVVAYGIGAGSVDDITKSIQGVFFQVQRMVSVQGLVGQVPMFGFILQPLVGILAMILSNAPMLGGVISYILVGPSGS